MSILDSDVLLALIRSTEDQEVADWVKQFPSKPQTTSLSVAEVTAAVYASSDPMRHFAQERALETLLGGLLHRRVLPLDADCASILAKLSTAQDPNGSFYPLGVLIQAAICRQFRMPLVTGRSGDYQGLDLELHPLLLDTTADAEAG
ncbi:PIN domain-containing protein [Arthrobacter sp. HLT1-21]